METDFFLTIMAQLPYYRTKLAAIAGTAGVVSIIDAAIAECQRCLDAGSLWKDQETYAPAVQNIAVQYQKLSASTRNSFDAALKADAQAKPPPHA